MAISSNSLFHYTNEISILKNILKDGFLVSLCQESVMAIPMISFCDIPLSNAKYFFKNYGSYAIGMKLEWAIENKLNPVLYIEENSSLNDRLYDAMESFSKLMDLETDSSSEISDEVMTIQAYTQETTRFAKPFKGDLVRNGQTIRNYKFYNEREWRYIPDMTNHYFPIGLSPLEYKEFKKAHPEKPHFKENGLTFNASDIKYILIKDETEIPEIIDFLMNTTSLGSANDIQSLFPKIIIAKQVEEDF